MDELRERVGDQIANIAGCPGPLEQLAYRLADGNEQLRAQLADAEAKQRHAEDFILREGYRPCDSATCNCPYWHGGNAHKRLAEISDALEDDRDGMTLLSTVEGLIRDISHLRHVIRETHRIHCTDAWTSRNLHAPECLLYELEDGDPQ